MGGFGSYKFISYLITQDNTFFSSSSSLERCADKTNLHEINTSPYIYTASY